MQKVKESVKLTSKHQLTLPIKVVRSLGLTSGDFLHYELKYGTVILRPRPTVRHQLSSMWAKNAKSNKGLASDVSIKRTLADYHRKKATTK